MRRSSEKKMTAALLVAIGASLTVTASAFGDRDSAAFVHDGDPTWTDYTLSLTVDPIYDTDWEQADVFFRTQDIEPDVYGVNGYFYRLVMWVQGAAEGPYLELGKETPGPAAEILFHEPGLTSTDPMDVLITLTGPRIQVSINGLEVIDLIDPDPILYGGIGVGAIWEAHARFDDVVVGPGLFEDHFDNDTMSPEWDTTIKPEQWVEDGWLHTQIPEPGTLSVLGVGGLALLRRRRA